MDKFVQDAFKAADRVEYDAFRRMIVANQEELLNEVADRVGRNQMYEMSKAVVTSGNTETFAAFVGEVIMMAFTAGWIGAKVQYL